MKSLSPVFGVVVLAVSGCSVYELQPLSMQHPANPQAMTGPERPLSKTLAYTQADIPSSQPNVAPSQQGGHEGHQMGGDAQKTVTGEGKVVAAVPGSSQVVVEHGKIEGFMDAMTMGYRVDPPSLLDGLKPGDQVRFTIDGAKKTIVKIEKK